MTVPQEPFALAGVTLNTEQRTSLANSLVLLRESQNFASAELWGIIQGVQKDYYVAKCKTGESLLDSKYFYSMDAVVWVQLPDVTSQDRQKAVNIRSKFTGDPAFEISEEGDEAAMNEEKRLAATVTEITNDVEVVPRGAYYKDATQKLAVNPFFEGVPKNELAQLSSYMHFRKGLDLDSKSMIERERLDESLDIFEDISQDQPKGIWSLQTYHGRPGYGPGSVAMLRSLLWPGYLSYHSVTTSASCHAQYGSIYKGLGLKNVDIGFML